MAEMMEHIRNLKTVVKGNVRELENIAIESMKNKGRTESLPNEWNFNNLFSDS